jgi:hypothetical protein
MSTEQKFWVKKFLLSKSFTWEKAKTMVVKKCNTPYRKFMQMGFLGALRQGPTESTREYGSKFQKISYEADFEEGVHLVVQFWISLRPTIRTASQTAVAQRYGEVLPTSLEKMIELVSGFGSDTSLLAAAASVDSIMKESASNSHGPTPKRQRYNGDNNK